MAQHLATLWRYRDLTEALVAKSKLESDGVRCTLADTEVVRLNWYQSDFFGGVRLQVADEDVEHAMALLSEEIPAAFTSEETGESYEQPHCPQCQSRDVNFEALHRGFALAFLWLASLPIWIPKRLWHCENCGYEWKAEYE